MPQMGSRLRRLLNVEVTATGIEDVVEAALVDAVAEVVANVYVLLRRWPTRRRQNYDYVFVYYVCVCVMIFSVYEQRSFAHQ